MERGEKNKRSTYQRITEEIRNELLERVINRKENIKRVVSEMNINISTAKAIVKVYKEEGRVGKKKKRDKVLNVIHTYSFYTLEGQQIQKIAPQVIQEDKKGFQTLEDTAINEELKLKSRQRAQQLTNQIAERHQISSDFSTQNVMVEPMTFNAMMNQCLAGSINPFAIGMNCKF